MERILALFLGTIRAAVRGTTNFELKALELKRYDPDLSGFNVRSIRAALFSQYSAGEAARTLQDMSGENTLRVSNFGYNPNISDAYRYTVRVTCRNAEHGPAFSTILEIDRPSNITRAEIQSEMDRFIKGLKARGSVYTDGRKEIESYAVCTSQIVLVERRSR